MQDGLKSIIVGIHLIKYAQLYIIEKLASKSMKVGKLLKCILNQHFLAGYQSDSIDFHFFIKLWDLIILSLRKLLSGGDTSINSISHATMLVQIQNLSEYDWAGGEGRRWWRGTGRSWRRKRCLMQDDGEEDKKLEHEVVNITLFQHDQNFQLWYETSICDAKFHLFYK